jgi:endonuclease III
MKNNSAQISRILKREYPEAKTSLLFANPLEMLISTILSAQCTDARVNIVTKSLFKKYKKASDYAKADIKELSRDIKSINYYKTKAKNIKKCCVILVNEYGSVIPNTLDELIQLPGVGRKTANVILGEAFHKIEGFVVDTHVSRVSYRLGLTKHHKKPEKIEQDLIKLFAKADWPFLSNSMVYHGRKICNARNPLCDSCKLSIICPKKGVKIHR